MRAKMSRPLCGSTPNQCSLEMPPKGPMGMPPVAGSTAVGSKVYGPQPLILVMNGAKTAISRTTDRKAMLRITGPVNSRLGDLPVASGAALRGAAPLSTSGTVAGVGMAIGSGRRVLQPERGVVDVPRATGVGEGVGHV